MTKLKKIKTLISLAVLVTTALEDGKVTKEEITGILLRILECVEEYERNNA